MPLRNLFRSNKIGVLNPNPAWIERDKNSIQEKKEKFKERTVIIKQSDLQKDQQEEAKTKKDIGHGASLDETNVEIAFIKDENGKYSKYILKKLGAIDSVISSELFRTISAGHYFAKREFIIYDEATESFYSAIKFENKIINQKIILEKELAEKKQYLETRYWPDSKKEELQKEIKIIEQKLETLPNSENEKTNNFLGKNLDTGNLDSASFGDVKDEFKEDTDFLSSYAYMLGVSQVFGESDNNPGNYTFRIADGRKVPGRFDLGMCVNLHPQPFGAVLTGLSPDFEKKAKEYHAANKYYEEYQDFVKGRLRQEPQPIQIQGSSQAYQDFITNDCKVIVTHLHALRQYTNGAADQPKPQLQCHEGSSKLLKEFRDIYKDFKHGDFVRDFRYNIAPHKEYKNFASDFYSTGVSADFRVRNYGCFQSLVFFFEHILGKTLKEDQKIAPMIKATRDYPKDIYQGDPELNENGELVFAEDRANPKHKWDQESLKKQAEKANDYQNKIMDIDPQKKNELLEELKKALEQDEKRKKYFIAFMHGMQNAINLAGDKDYLDALQKKYQDPKGYCAAIFQKHREFLQANAQEAKKQFGIFLDYYIKKRAELQSFDNPIKSPLALESQKKKDFANGQTITLTANYLKDANKKMVKRFTGKAYFRIKERRYGKSQRSQFKLNPFAVTEIQDLHLTKAKTFDAKIFDEEAPQLDEFQASNFDDSISLFKEKAPQLKEDKPHVEIKKEFHVNFSAKYNFGGKTFADENTNDEKKTRRSSAAMTLAFLQQRAENKSGKEFLDLRLGRYSDSSGRPILIEGQYFAQGKTEVQIDELAMHFVRDKKRLTNQTDAAKYIFATAFQGFMLCAEKSPGAIVRCGIDEQSWVDPYLQMAMLILAQKCVNHQLDDQSLGHQGIDLRLTGKFLDEERNQEKFAYFKKRILPSINQELKNGRTTIAEKIFKIQGLCQQHDQGIQQEFALNQTGLDNQDIKYKADNVNVTKADDNVTKDPNIYATIPNPTPRNITIAKITKPSSLSKLQQDINAIIDKTAGDNPQRKKHIIILLDALAEYGLEHLKIEQKIESITQGGANAGFSAWRNDEDFLKKLQEHAEKKGEKGLDFHNPQIMEDFATLSYNLQLNSKGIFSQPENKKYYGERSAIAMARSWRIALLRNIDGPSLVTETTPTQQR